MIIAAMRRDLELLTTGDYWYIIGSDKVLVSLRRRFFPKSLHYVLRYQPPTQPSRAPNFPLSCYASAPNPERPTYYAGLETICRYAHT
jgi:hypothetical protein